MSLAVELKNTITRHLEGASATDLGALIALLSRPDINGADEVRSVAAARFTKLADDQVRDNRSGLTWSKTLAGGKNVNHAEAERLCRELGEGWSLPTVEQLRELVDYTRRDPAIDTAYFGDTKSDWNWTSTLYAGYSDSAWIVGFSSGSVLTCYRGNGACVRAVRVSQS